MSQSFEQMHLFSPLPSSRQNPLLLPRHLRLLLVVVVVLIKVTVLLPIPLLLLCYSTSPDQGNHYLPKFLLSIDPKAPNQEEQLRNRIVPVNRRRHLLKRRPHRHLPPGKMTGKKSFARKLLKLPSSYGLKQRLGLMPNLRQKRKNGEFLKWG